MDMIASFLVAIIGMFYPVITRHMLNDYIPNKNIKMVVLFGITLLVVYIIRLLLRYFIQYYGHIMGVGMQAKMRSDLFQKIERLPYSYFDDHETGKLMTRMTNDLFEISELAHHGPENLLIASFTIIASFLYLLFIEWKLALICFCVVPILVILSSYFRRKMKIAFKETRIAQSEINNSIESSISGIRVTKAYTNEKEELKKFEKSNKLFVEARKKSLSAMAKFNSSSAFVTDIFNVLILIAGGFFLYNGEIDFADYSTFIVSINLFISPINQLVQFMEQYQEASTGFSRFIEIIDEKEEIDEGKKVLNNPKGKIEFENVSFKYSDKRRLILDNVSFSIKAGEKIAFVGPTGGGKTTICHLLTRFYPLSKGTIKIDGIKIEDLKLHNLRENIGIIQQDVFLFAGTIKDNIKYGKEDATDDEVLEAVRRANLADFIESLPEGLDTQIGERGVRISGGQKQRISIARCFIKDPAILILDEATSALDNSTEFQIQEVLEELCKNRTTIEVAHRLSTIRNADRTLVISKGKIIEQGTHKELMELNGIYKSLYDLQFKE